MGGDSCTKDKGANSGKFDKYVDGRTRCVLERISDGVTNNRGGMFSITLLNKFFLIVLGVFASKLSSFDELLAVVPSTTRVRCREGNLDTRDNGSSEESIGGLVAEEPTNEEWG